MKGIIGLCMAALLVVGVANSAFGEEGGGAKAEKEKPAKVEKQSKAGTVQKVDAAGMKIVVLVTRELTFTLTTDTKITQGDVAKTLADIKVGDSVTVDYTRADKDTRVATKIVIAAAAAATPAPAPAK